MSNMQDTKTDLETRFLEMAASVFGVAASDIALGSSADDVEGWDSYTHMQLVLETENRFAIQLKASEVGDIYTLGDLFHLVEQRATDRA